MSKVITDRTWVDECIDNYQTKYKLCTDTSIKNTYTESVAHDLDALIDWLQNTVKNNTDADTIKVELGVYNGYFANATPAEMIKIKQNKVTTFLVPYTGSQRAQYTTATSQNQIGDEADAFDLGDLKP